MNCRNMSTELANLLLDPKSVAAGSRLHVEQCADCRRELAELRATLSLMDAWTAPEVTPFFNAKLLARLRAEQQGAPAGFWERLKARIIYGSSLRMQPLMAGALALVIMAGGGAYANLAWRNGQPQESATVHDLQSLDGNAQVFQQLDFVDQSGGQQDQTSGTPGNAPSND